jgi:hypothetical protein
MADTKLTDLTAATVVNDADLLYLVQSGTDKRVPASLLAVPAAARTWTAGQAFTAGASIGTVDSDQQLAIYSGNGPAFRLLANSENVFFTHVDPTLAISWNHSDAPDYDTNRHTWGIHWESDYYPTVNTHQCEWYLSYKRATTHEEQRPLAISTSLDTHTATIEFAASTVGFTKSDGTDTLLAFNTLNGLIEVYTGKALYLNGTAALGIGAVPTAGGTPLLIGLSADGYAAQFTRATAGAAIQMFTTYANIGTTSSHPVNFMAGGDDKLSIATTGIVTINKNSLVLNGGTLLIQRADLYGTLRDLAHYAYPGMTTHVNKLRGSIADGGAANASGNLLQWELNNGSNATNPVLRLQGDKRAMIAAAATAPTDADLFAGSISFYLDQSSNKVMVRVKYSDGTTLKTGELAIA